MEHCTIIDGCEVRSLNVGLPNKFSVTTVSVFKGFMGGVLHDRIVVLVLVSYDSGQNAS
jgi:hypothetical protein